MTPNEQNRALLADLRTTITAFTAGSKDLDEMQSKLQTTMALLENDPSGRGRAVRLAEADVEEIRFTTLLADQFAAVANRMSDLLAELA